MPLLAPNRPQRHLSYTSGHDPGVRRTQYFYHTAFSTQFGDLRPGTLLLAMAIESAARKGVEIIDMLRGYEAHKQSWQLEWIATRGFVMEYSADALGVSSIQKTA